VATSPHSAVGSSGDGTDAAETGNDEEQQEHKQKQTQKSTALIYVLETLPLRFQALASAYGAFNGASITGNDDMMVLGDDLQRLLTLSQGTMVDGEQEEHSQFEGWYDPKFFQNRKIKAMDDEVRYIFFSLFFFFSSFSFFDFQYPPTLLLAHVLTSPDVSKPREWRNLKLYCSWPRS